MITQGMIKRDGKAIALAGRCPRAAGQDAQIEAAVMSLFQSGGFTARSMNDMKGLSPLSGLAFKPEDSARVFGYLVKRGDVVKVKEGVYMSGMAVNDAKERLSAHITEKGPIKAAEFRDILGAGLPQGVGRKLEIEILEYFDKERVTLRQGDLRVLRGSAPSRGKEIA